MPAHELHGVPAAPGVAVGRVRLLTAPAASGVKLAPAQRAAEVDRARAALATAAEQLDAVADGLRRRGRDAEAEIVATGALMARDPLLQESVESLVGGDGLPAPEGLLAACAAQADLLAALPEPTLAARADDVRSLGRRAARLAAGSGGDAGGGVIVAEDLGPADVAELAPTAHAIVLAGGGATAHAAIVARGLGVPMVAGLGAAALELIDGDLVVVDGSAGLVVASPDPARVEAVRALVRRRESARANARRRRDEPAETIDGHRVTVLANVAGAAEVELALEAGAEGIGLLRTELGFLDAGGWPTENDHLLMLEPILAAANGRPTTVRVLDFGGDKTPPFLAGEERRGLELLLSAPDALAAQLRAIVRAGTGRDVRILLPLVDTPAALDAAAVALASAGASTPPPLGPMIETPRAAAAADALAARAGFLSVGTNDLTAAVLGVDRFGAGGATAHDPRVLAAIAAAVAAAKRAGIALEVCGEAASDPIGLPLLIGLGVDEVSVAASRVGTVRAWVRGLDRAEVSKLARQALAASSAAEVEQLAGPLAQRLASLESGDAIAQRVERERRVVAAGDKP